MECYASSSLRRNYFFHLIPLISFESIRIMTFKVQLGNHLLTIGIGHLVMNMWNWSNFISAREGGVVPVMSILVCVVQASIPQFLSEGALIPIVNLISDTASTGLFTLAQSWYTLSCTGRPAAILHILRARFPGACHWSRSAGVVGLIFVRRSMPHLHLCSRHRSTGGVIHITLHKQIDLIGRSDVTEQRKEGVGDEEGAHSILFQPSRTLVARTCLTCGYVTVVPQLFACCGDAPGPRIPVWVPAVVVVPDTLVVPVVLGPIAVGVWPLRGPLLAQHAILGGGGGASVGGTVANNTVVISFPP